MKHKLISMSLVASLIVGVASIATATPPLPNVGLTNVPPKCGPGYQAENITYRLGVLKNYGCAKEISDQKICQSGMQLQVAPYVSANNKLKLRYSCYLLEQ